VLTQVNERGESATPILLTSTLNVPRVADALRRAGASLEEIELVAEAMRLDRTVGARRPEYHYDQDVEAFFRHSPAVVRDQPRV